MLDNLPNVQQRPPVHAVHPSAFVQYSKESLQKKTTGILPLSIVMKLSQEWITCKTVQPNFPVPNQNKRPRMDFDWSGDEWSRFSPPSIWMVNLVNFCRLWLHPCHSLMEWLVSGGGSRGGVIYTTASAVGPCCYLWGGWMWTPQQKWKRTTNSCIYKEITYHCSNTVNTC